MLSSVLIVISVLFLVHAIVRGTLVQTPVDPSAAGDGVVCGLNRLDDGSKRARCALFIDAPIDAVWGVITDYPHYPQIFPYLRTVAFANEPDGRVHMSGVASTKMYRDWPFDLYLVNQVTPELRTASWDEPGGRLTTNRGNWTARRISATQTLLSYSLEITVRHLPHFILRNVLLDHIPAVLLAVKTHLP